MYRISPYRACDARWRSPLTTASERAIIVTMRNLGVIFDSNLKMDMQITKACQIAYYHLHNIRRVRKFLSQEATCRIIHAFITSQIDYCNSLMNGLPENLIKKLQRVQNTAARLVFNLRKYDRITPALVTLHWLPVKYRIEFKTLLIVFKGLGKAPIYIQEMITPSKSKRYSIRSNEERVLKVPNSSMILSASVHSQYMGLWHGIVCQRKLGYAMKLKHSSET